MKWRWGRVKACKACNSPYKVCKKYVKSLSFTCFYRLFAGFLLAFLQDLHTLHTFSVQSRIYKLEG